MKKEWTEQDLCAFAENAQTAFEDVTLTEADEEAADTWQDDGLQVDYVLRNGQVDCVLRRLIEADGKLWQLQMTAPLAGSDLPEDRMTARERELCRDDMNHDFLTGVFNRRYFETEFCTRLDEWTDAHRCASLALVALDDKAQTLPLPEMYGKNLTFKTGGVDGCDCEETLRLIAEGKIDTEPLITHTYPLRRIAEGYELFEKKRDGVIKVAVEC